MSEPIDISVVIPARNEAGYLSQCLQSIRNAQSEDDTYEIIVVDNNSTDDTVPIAHKHGCIVVSNDKAGPASSRNKGAFIAKGRFIAFIDADCTLDKRWFQFTREHFSDPGVAVVGTKISPDFDTATWVEKTLFLMNNRRKVSVSGPVARVEWIGTSNMLVRKDAFGNVGGFNGELLTCEDYDLCQRISRFGAILLERRIYTVHLRESKTLLEFFQRELWRGRDNLKQFLQSGRKLGAAPSVVLPGIFILLIAVGFVSLPLSLKLASFSLGFAFACPLVMTLRSASTLKTLSAFLSSVVVSSCYLAARGLAMIREVMSGKLRT